MIFLNAIELFPYLNEIMEKKLCEKDPCDIEVNISTYGISLYDKKNEYDNSYEETKAKEFLRLLDGTNTKMLVGIPPKKKFSKQSYGLSTSEFKKKVKEIFDIGDEYRIECVPSENLHFKFYRIDDIYITGGINFGNSKWNDCAVLIENKEDKERLQFLFDCSWNGAVNVHPILLNKI